MSVGDGQMQTSIKKSSNLFMRFFPTGLKMTCTIKNDLHPKGAANNVNKPRCTSVHIISILIAGERIYKKMYIVKV